MPSITWDDLVGMNLNSIVFICPQSLSVRRRAQPTPRFRKAGRSPMRRARSGSVDAWSRGISLSCRGSSLLQIREIADIDDDVVVACKHRALFSEGPQDAGY